jgi:hypothetical protein
VIAVVVGVFVGGCWWALWQLIAGHVHTPVDAIAQTRENHSWILAFNLPAWILQMIGVFPYRDQPIPLFFYPLALLVICLFLIAAHRVSRPVRERRVVDGLVLACLVLPVAASIVLMPSYGAIWQGRYELVFAIGILPVCGLVMDRRGFGRHEGDRLTVTALLFLAIVHVASVVVVMHRELGRSVSTEQSGWTHPPLAVVAALAFAGFVVLAGLSWQARGVLPARVDVAAGREREPSTPGTGRG